MAPELCVQHLLVVYPNVGWNAADKTNELLALDDTDTDVPVTSPTWWLESPTVNSFTQTSQLTLQQLP